MTFGYRDITSFSSSCPGPNNLFVPSCAVVVFGPLVWYVFIVIVLLLTGLTAPGGFLASMRQDPREPSRTSQPSTSRSEASAEGQQPDGASEEKAGANLGDGTADLIARCQALCESWQADLMRAPELYGPALSTFISRYERMKTDNSRVSSLHQFGTGSSAVPASSFKSSVTIGVQPTAVARRKVPVGGNASTGRSKKDGAAGDHGAYAVSTKVAQQSNLSVLRWCSQREPHTSWRSVWLETCLWVEPRWVTERDRLRRWGAKLFSSCTT